MKTLEISTLEDEYCDQRALIAHAAFQCLVDFIELEHAENRIIWDDDESHKEAWKEIIDLYNWWKLNNTREEFEDVYYEELQTNLHRLIDVRGFIWI